MSATPERRFTDSRQPVATGAARALLDGAGRLGNAADLAGLMAIVPTRQAGRKLREALAAEAVAAGFSGVLLPKIHTPDTALHAFGRPVATASAEAAQMAMTAAIVSFPPEELAALLPEPPSPWGVATLRAVARDILKARHSLGDAGDIHDFAAVAGRDDNPEPERWGDLAKIEVRYRRALGELGLTDAGDVRAATVRHPVSPEGIRRVAVLAVPELSPALRRLLENTGLPVTVVIADGESGPEAFDEWGAPVPGFWGAATIPWENFDRQVRTPDSPAALVRDLATLFAGNKADGRTTGLIAADAGLAGILERALLDTGADAFRADGESLDRHPHAVILRDWADFLRDASWEALERLLRRPPFAKAILRGTESGDLFALLREADRTGERLLPRELPTFAESDAKEKGRELVEAVVRNAGAWRREFLAAGFDRAVAGFLAKLGDAGDVLDAPFRELVDAVAPQLAALLAHFPDHDAPEALGLLHRKISSARRHPETPAEAVAIRGWLEMLWEDTPHLLIAGLNEGAVPESVTADAFLPGGFRDKLGLTSDTARVARDTYALSRALAMRAGGRGRVDVFAPKADAKGDPLRPSRLLFTGAGETLPARVMRLFAEAGGPPSEPLRTRGWRFAPRVVPEKLRAVEAGVAPTAFADYLDCPFRFYLKRVLRAEPAEPDRAEPDAAAFGTLVHNVLAGFAESPAERDLDDEALIRAALDRRIDLELTKAYGERPPLAAIIQANAARARLHGFARTQAAHRAEGWRIDKVEEPFELRLDLGDGREPFVVKGRFDRIDRHSDGRIRIIDYKTSDAGKGPADIHLKRRSRGGYERRDYAYTLAATNAKGEPEERRWTNLQLPVYAEYALAAGLAPFEKIGVAYWLLPAAASDVALSPWDGYTRDLHADALRCAAGIARDLRARRFGPPNPKPEYDDFELLLGDDPESAVDFDTFNAELAKA